MKKYNIIKIKAIEKELSYADIANKIKISEQTISNWVNGRATSQINNFIALCKLLDIDIKDL